ncbi:phospho-sugar mutase [Pontimonas sp.]|nr:phospho-sugar mutase [Pontimonas sp.]
MPTPELVAQVKLWRDQDPDPETRGQLDALLDSHANGDAASLTTMEALFSGRLAFGTAGIRGRLQPGPMGMNRVVIGQTTAGLAHYLLEQSAPGSSDAPRVVIGCDARTNSRVFAEDTAAIVAGYGLRAILLPAELPTPVLAFAVRALKADAGVMVTASHNPPQDNGYKVYLGGKDEGSQIIPPVDAAIERSIMTVAESTPWDEIPRDSSAIQLAPPQIVADYISSTLDSVSAGNPAAGHISAVYTAMHGVGAGTFFELLRQAGFDTVAPVTQQTEPDPAFPTVAFPNPEEPGALDLSIATARERGAELIIAHDPDADRLALALPRGNDFVMLTGNQVGAILGWHCASRAVVAGKHGSLANSLVSSPVLGKIAHHFGLDHHETLTGFKYVSRVPELIFGFEEALGYLVSPDVARDKDGISAGLMALDLATQLAGEDKTLWDYLADIEDAVGGFASSQITIALSSSEQKNPLPERLRNSPPQKVGERTIVSYDDFLTGVDSFPKENILRYYLDDGSRIIIRPSGTEPKLKVYLDTQGDTRVAAEAALVTLESDMRTLIDSL